MMKNKVNTHIGKVKLQKKLLALQHKMHCSCYLHWPDIFTQLSQRAKLTNKTTARWHVCVLAAKTSREHVKA